MIPIIPDWMTKLPLQQQAVLLLGLRGPDGFEKHHASKPIVWFYRACILKAAHTGRMMKTDEHIPTFMTMRYFYYDKWQQALNDFREIEDQLPLHFYTHLMHGAQVLAYKHPNETIQQRWFQFYFQCCSYLHVTTETENEMDKRLCDFGRERSEVLP